MNRALNRIYLQLKLVVVHMQLGSDWPYGSVAYSKAFLNASSSQHRLKISMVFGYASVGTSYLVQLFTCKWQSASTALCTQMMTRDTV